MPVHAVRSAGGKIIGFALVLQASCTRLKGKQSARKELLELPDGEKITRRTMSFRYIMLPIPEYKVAKKPKRKNGQNKS